MEKKCQCFRKVCKAETIFKLKDGYEMQNHSFKTDSCDEVEWVMEYYSKNESLSLYTENKCNDCTVLIAQGSLVIVPYNHHLHLNQTHQFRYCSIFNETNLIYKNKENFCMKISSIKCSLNFVYGPKPTEIKSIAIPKIDMACDFGEFLDNKKLMDITLVVGDHKFQAHKAILSARSSVFAAMFAHKMEKTVTNTVTITDIDHTVFEQMLFFIYKNDVPKLKETHTELLAAADKYALNGLKRMCQNSIFEDISIETAVSADPYNDDFLKMETLKYVAENIEKIRNTQEWNTLNAASLAKEILKFKHRTLTPIETVDCSKQMENSNKIYEVDTKCCLTANITYQNYKFHSGSYKEITFLIEIFQKEKIIRLRTAKKPPNSIVLVATGKISDEMHNIEQNFNYCSLHEEGKPVIGNVIHEFTYEDTNSLPTFVIECKFLFSPIYGLDKKAMVVAKNEMSDDFIKFLDSKELIDVTLIVGEHKFQAHKAILSARSAVFAAMFEHEMKENITNTVTITDIDHTVFEQMLFFIYKNDVPKLKEMHTELLAAADKYALKGLKQMCENSIFENISIETAVETLCNASLYNADFLKMKTLKYITENSSKF